MSLRKSEDSIAKKVKFCSSMLNDVTKMYELDPLIAEMNLKVYLSSIIIVAMADTLF